MSVTPLKLIVGAVVLAGAGHLAAETIAYTYDAQGRLERVERTGAPQGTETAQYTFDRADNRTFVETRLTNPTPSGGTGVPFSTVFSFETPEVGTGFVYNPSDPNVTFAGATGIAGNGSAWGFSLAPNGDQVAFLQSGPGSTASISMPLSGFSPGRSYRVQVRLARRPGYGISPVTISWNGNVLGTYTPASNAFTEVITPSFVAPSGPVTITFSAGAQPGDSGTGLDLAFVQAL